MPGASLSSRRRFPHHASRICNPSKLSKLGECGELDAIFLARSRLPRSDNQSSALFCGQLVNADEAHSNSSGRFTCHCSRSAKLTALKNKRSARSAFDNDGQKVDSRTSRFDSPLELLSRARCRGLIHGVNRRWLSTACRLSGCGRRRADARCNPVETNLTVTRTSKAPRQASKGPGRRDLHVTGPSSRLGIHQHHG